MEQTQTASEALLRLEEPFASKEVKWIVKATSRDGRKGRVVPYADPRAYTDRLNQVFTASGWTRQYTVHTVSPITRVKKDKAIQTGKVMVTCVVSINGFGSQAGSGEDWADNENAMTSAEAQAFKRACSVFGLGRYFYDFDEMWVEINEYKQPREFPDLPSWALPVADRKNAGSRQTSQATERTDTVVQKGPLDAGVTSRIESCRREVGQVLYANILGSIAKVRSARDIPNQQLQMEVLKWMESGVRGLSQVRAIASEIPDTKFYEVLDDLKIASIDKIPNFGVLAKLVKEMKDIHSQGSEISAA
jgi:hypothetical protein